MTDSRIIESMKEKRNTGKFIRTWGTLMGFILLFVIFTIIRPDVFPSGRNIRNIIEQVATLAIVASGVTVVMVTGDFDLSVGAIASLVGIVCAMLMEAGINTPVSIFIALLLGTAAGFINGVLVAYGGLSAFVSTLATMTAFGGLSLLLSRGTTIFGLPENFRFLGQGSLGFIPFSVILMVIVLVVVYLMLEQTTYGRRLYAIGGNEEASFLSGINTKKVRLAAFCLSGFFAAVGGVVLTSRLYSAHPQAGSPFMLNAAAAVFLGMTAFRDGEANLWGTLLGVLIMGVMGNGLNILGINTYVQSILTGVIIIMAVLLSSLAKKKA
ncbi:MAG: ABC transporter permease [Spirochaetales bacterium]|nr:ABC transporter permease [Spirochaetales bacterium]